MNVKILVVYHKTAPIVSNETLVPIHVGSSDKSTSDYFKNKAIFDNTGDNISNKNAKFNELTAVYWAWKNYDKLGNPDYIGLCHYRRFFVFENGKNPYFECTNIDDKFFDKIKYSEDAVEKLLEKGDFVAPIPTKRHSVKLNYSRAHRPEDLALAGRILHEKHPDFESAAIAYLEGEKSYYHNMFIFDKKTFFRYCEWLFDILFEYEKQTPYPNERFYVSERLTGIFFTKLQEEGLKPVLLPTLFIAGKKPRFKEVVAQTKINLKLKNSSKLYAFKPIILYFIPNFLLKMRRSRRCK